MMGCFLVNKKANLFSLPFLYIFLKKKKLESLILSPYPSPNFAGYPAHPTTNRNKHHHPLLHTQNTNKKMCLTPLTGLSKRGALKIPLLGGSLFVALFLTRLQNTLPTLSREKRRALWELMTKAKSLLWKCMVVFYQKIEVPLLTVPRERKSVSSRYDGPTIFSS